MRCDVIAEGIINAAKNLNIQIPVIVRLQVCIILLHFFYYLKTWVHAFS